MGILGSIINLFKKKEPEIPEELREPETSAEKYDSLGMSGRRAMATDFPPEGSSRGMSSSDSNSMIMTKLDMISIKLDNLDRRVQYIEKVAKESEK